MKEDAFVDEALHILRRISRPPLSVERGAALLYAVTVNAKLEVTVDPKRPRRGQSAFQTDLCIFETVDGDIAIPRVVLEFKSRLTTHDVLTYSAKARRHKQIYPYLRYGLLLAQESTIPSRFYRHNEGLDFCIAVNALGKRSVRNALRRLVEVEIDASRTLEATVFERRKARLFRSGVFVSGIRKRTAPE